MKKTETNGCLNPATITGPIIKVATESTTEPFNRAISPSATALHYDPIEQAVCGDDRRAAAINNPLTPLLSPISS